MGSFRKFINWYFSKDKLPYWCILLLDCLLIFFTAVIVYCGFFNINELEQNFWPLVRLTILYLSVNIVFFKIFHTYSGIIRFSSFVDLMRVAFAMLSSGAVIVAMNYYIRTLPETWFVHLLTRHIITIIVVAITIMWGMRMVVKVMYDSFFRTDAAVNVFIYGVKDGGVGLAKQIRNEKPSRFSLRGFISHDPNLKYSRLLGEKVYEADENLPMILKKERVSAVLVAPQRNELFRKDKKLQDYIIDAGVRIYMVKSAEEWDKNENTSCLREVSIGDLLPRAQIDVDMESVANLISGKKVLITGSAGSIGSEIVRQVCSYAPSMVILVDQAETPQHDMRLMVAKEFPGVEVCTILTSITNAKRIEHIFKVVRPDYVFHAAAYKHVPMMEDNPSESVHNNIYGTKIVADLSIKYGVKKFVMISTDKAVNPTNVMGCSKRICEIYVQSLNKAELEGKIKGNTQFVTTRFGNVLGSNGSVIPLFEKQIREGGPVTVTDPDIIRYFMLIPEACKLVLEAGTKGNGGEIFVFDMGSPVKIADLAKRMIQLSGAQGIEIKYTGLRNGEKLYEEVLNEKEITKPSFHEKIRIATVREFEYSAANKEICELIELSESYDNMAIVAKMKQIVPEYKSNNSIYSSLDS